MTPTGESGAAADREIATARVIDATPARVFDAFRDPVRPRAGGE